MSDLVNVVLEPNPELTEGQQRAIALDYGMSDRTLTVSVRYALLCSFNKRLRLDTIKVAQSSGGVRAVVTGAELEGLCQ
jgi:hypothetical protein